MKTLVVYYSNSGTTRLLAESLAEQLGAGIEAIRERNPRPVLKMPQQGEKPEGTGIMRAAMAAFLGLGSRIVKPERQPDAYDLVVVGGPIWAGSLTPPVRTYLRRNRKRIGRVAFFCSCTKPEKLRAFGQMRRAVGREPEATLAVPADDVRSGAMSKAVSDFARTLGVA